MSNTWTSNDALYRLTVSNLAATPPVSPEEEKRLINLMFDGKEAASQLKRRSNLGREERRALEATKEAGEAARRMLIQANGRLVIKIATQYMNRGLTLAELSQEGTLGLIRAIDKFDREKGNRLSTYATFWIRQNISRAIAIQTRTVRLPVHKVEALTKIRKVMGKLTQELGHPPSIEEIAERLDDTSENIRNLLKDGQDILSLEEPVGDDGATMGDFIENEFLQNVENQVDSTLLVDEIRQALSTLPARESRILELRYGLRNGQPHSLRDIAERFGLTRERIRQLERDALNKIRESKTVHRLAEFTS